MDRSRSVYERAVKVHYPVTDDAVSVWIAYAEDELKAAAASNERGLPEAFKDVMSRAFRNELVRKSTRLWSFYIDTLESHPDLIEESSGL